MERIEDVLNQMSKPELDELQHEEILARTIVKGQAEARISFWWISIPIYFFLAFLMKSYYTPNLSVPDALHEPFRTHPVIILLVFWWLPATLILICLLNARNAYFLFGNSRKPAFLRIISGEIIVILVSLIVLAISFYETFIY